MGDEGKEEEDEQEIMNIHATMKDLTDPYKCTTSAQDEDTCKNTKDDDNKACDWCTVLNYGACFSDDIAKQIQQMIPIVECSSSLSDESLLGEDEQRTTTSFDMSCVFAAGFNDDSQNVCGNALDSNNNACVWCSLPGSNYGLCVTSDEADQANQFLTCDKKNRHINSCRRRGSSRNFLIRFENK